MPNPLVDPVPPPPALRRPLLADPKFLRLWLVGGCAATARWLEMLAVGIFVFEETRSPLLVAAMLMLRMLPLGLFGVFGGEIASRLDRKQVLLATFAVLSVLACVLATLAGDRDCLVRSAAARTLCGRRRDRIREFIDDAGNDRTDWWRACVCAAGIGGRRLRKTAAFKRPAGVRPAPGDKALPV